MSFDVLNASLVAGGEGVPVLPVLLEGLHVQPSFETLSSQVTGDAATVLVLRHTAGAARIFGFVKEFDAAELAVVTTSGVAHLTAGQAQWFAVVVVKHKNAAAISILAVGGTVAAFASVAKPTHAEILTALGLDDANAILGILGDIRFYRVSDVVIDVATESIRRPWYTFDAKKTSRGLKDQADPTTLLAVPDGHVDFPIDLATAFGLGAGVLMIDGADLPSWPYGGEITGLEYLGTVDGAGAGGDITLLAGIDGVAVTGGALQLLLAGTSVPAKVDSTAVTATASFKPGDGLDIEVDAAATAFTAGSGIVRVHLSRYE